MQPLWIFPESDFIDWRILVPESDCKTYQEYLTKIAGNQADFEQQGIEVVRIKMTVAEMREELERQDCDNTEDNRWNVIALRLKQKEDGE